MPIDPYSPCPGGTGKKVKFCCSDLVSDLDKVQRMIDAEQYAGCLDLVNRLDEKYANRPCLLSYKQLLEQITGQREKATETLTKFVAQFPNNPVALAESGLNRVQQGDVRGGIELVQQALELSGDELHERVYAAIGVLGEVLLISQHILPARGHLLLQTLLSGGQDERPLQLLMRVESTPGVPVLLKDGANYADPPDDAPWKKGFEDALMLAARGQWRKAAERWQSITAQAADAAAAWKNLAIVRPYLADYAGAVEALHKFASLSGPTDEAVEAEALAQLLDRERTEGAIDSLFVTFAVNEIDELERRLAASREVDREEIDTREYTAAQQVPPRAVYWLLDRPVVANNPTIAREEIPQVLAHVAVYGKRTDRDARVELDVQRPQLEAARAALTSIVGNALGQQVSEEIAGHLPAAQFALSWQWRLPLDVSPAHRRKLIAEERRRRLLEVWPTLPLPLLDDKTPEQAASEPACRPRLLGAILLLEVTDSNVWETDPYNELRQKLNLPVPGPIDPAGLDFNATPVIRFTRFEVEKMTGEQLAKAMQRLMFVRFEPAMRRIANQLVRRTDLEKPEYKLPAYQFLVQTEEDPDRALEHLTDARKLAERQGQSSAPWDLDELMIRIQRQEPQEMVRLIQHIQKEHGREPGIAESLFTMLSRLGMLTPDGRILIPAGPAPAAAAAESGKIWTPDSGQPATGTKSGLWVPE